MSDHLDRLRVALEFPLTRSGATLFRTDDLAALLSERDALAAVAEAARTFGTTCTCPNGPMPGHYIGCPLAGRFGLPRPTTDAGRDALAAVAEAPLNAGLLLKLLAESDIATTTYNDVRRVLVAVCAAYDRTVAKP